MSVAAEEVYARDTSPGEETAGGAAAISAEGGAGQELPIHGETSADTQDR